MSKRVETISEIVAKMRDWAAINVTFTARTMGTYADHIEAAHEREVAELRREMNNRAIIAGVSIADGETAKLKAQVAELKEAFAKTLERIDDQVRWTIAHIKCNELDDYTGALYTASHALEHIDRARAALEKTEGKGE